jgi:uncharacterized membrane protein YgcG
MLVVDALALAGAHIHRAEVFEVALGTLLAALRHFKLVLGLANSQESPSGSELRWHLKVFREYLKKKLAEEQAALPDAIVPYLFALQLTSEAYRWFGEPSQGCMGERRGRFGHRTGVGSSDWSSSSGSGGGGGSSGSSGGGSVGGW